jgi:hypothetical protein
VTVFKHPNGRTFSYDFRWRGERYIGNTGQTTKTDAQAAEAEIKRTLRLKAAGLLAVPPAPSPRFQEWSEIYYDDVRTRRRDHIKRPERIEGLVRCVLRFFGQRPAPQVRGKLAAIPGEPYHDLRLSAPIDDPMWLLKFEDWMQKKGSERANEESVSIDAQSDVRVGAASGVSRAHACRDESVPRAAARFWRRAHQHVDCRRAQALDTHASYHVRLAWPLPHSRQSSAYRTSSRSTGRSISTLG